MIAITRWHWALAVGFWSFLAAVYVAQLVWMIPEMPGVRINRSAALTWQLSYYAAWVPLTIVIWRCTAGWVPDTAGVWRRIVAQHVLIFVIVLVVLMLVTTAVAMLLGQIPGDASQAFGREIGGRSYLTLLMYIIVAGGGVALTLHDRYRERQAAAAAFQAELATARLQALRNHLEPHFLFNSLHSIAALARAGDTPGVVRLIAALSDLLRHVLDAADRHASLREELQIVERYLEIQRARFADRLEVTVDLAPDVADARVPLLIVQPLVENAVRHGLAPRVREGSLAIRAVRDNDHTRIDVEDTGVGLPPNWSLREVTGTGLRNLASRLSAEFGDAAALDVRPREGGGVRATVTLPYARS